MNTFAQTQNVVIYQHNIRFVGPQKWNNLSNDTRNAPSLNCFKITDNRCVLAQSVERPPHNREVVGSIPGRVIPKDVKRWELLLPCLALNI